MFRLNSRKFWKKLKLSNLQRREKQRKLIFSKEGVFNKWVNYYFTGPKMGEQDY